MGAVAAWALKATAIAVAGGLDQSPFEGPLFGLGLILLLTAFAATGLAITTGRRTGMRVLGAGGGLLAVGLVAWSRRQRDSRRQ